jgi:enoyl-CoA hydratase
MGDPHLLVEREGPILICTMNRPERKNALSGEMLARMADAWVQIDEDPEIRVAILTGAGGTFCAGADLKEMAGGRETNEWSKRFVTDPDLQWKGLLRHYRVKKPLIAAVEGFAVAGNIEILQGTDIDVAGRGATFDVAEVRRGLFPVGGSTVGLRRQIPYTLAAELLLTGRMVPAEEALRIGLIGHVVPDGEALAEAKKIAEQIAANGPLAVQAVLRSLRETESMPEREALQRELEIGIPIFATEDAREGPRAFA